MDAPVPSPTGPAGETQHLVGSDVVRVAEDRLIVFARREMIDWKIRQFCVVPIYFRGHKFHLVGKSPGPAPFAYRYELALWHAGVGNESTLAIHYNEDYVAERDQAANREKRYGHLHPALFVFYPFLGFCWTGFKERVLAAIGFDPVEITEASVMFAFAFFMLEGVFVFYFRAGFLGMLFGRSLLFLLDWLLMFIVPLDCAMRFGRLIFHDSVPPGFMEWLFRRRGAASR